MALKKETIKQICDKLKIKQDDFEAAIKVDGEVDVPIDDKLEVLTAEEITTLKANEYKSGKETGVEMAPRSNRTKRSRKFKHNWPPHRLQPLNCKPNWLRKTAKYTP
jgi:hypothetical protein